MNDYCTVFPKAWTIDRFGLLVDDALKFSIQLMFLGRGPKNQRSSQSAILFTCRDTSNHIQCQFDEDLFPSFSLS